MKTSRNPKTIHAPLAPYVHQMEVSANEKLLVLSGQVGVRQDGTSPTDFVQQLELAWLNVGENLKEAGMSYKDIIKLTVYMVGQLDPATKRSAFGPLFREVNPCMTLLYVSALGADDLKVEIDVLASAQ